MFAGDLDGGIGGAVGWDAVPVPPLMGEIAEKGGIIPASDERAGRSCYVLENAHDVQVTSSVFFVYGDREHIRFLLRSIFVDNDDQDFVNAHLGQTADLWFIENGRRAGHVDLHSLISVYDDAGSRRVELDWLRFDELVPVALSGSVLRHGEELRLLAAHEDFAETRSNLPLLYPDTPIGYGMQVWVEGDLTDEPYEVYPDPDPAERG